MSTPKGVGASGAFLCGKVGDPPVQKILRNGHTVTICVGTGGMFDQRIVGGNDVPRPVQWHRIVIQNEN
ncbi:Single-stranded DNA-binding protein [Carex littledalei]|uniref:Single-stranded DNA-binding protein n=1 Tax=Carex littledalei TaxID=544730 RepID=A0A833QSI8_9POAL|nr:Single-stranded DNA-binding protein [Carex littledalei]